VRAGHPKKKNLNRIGHLIIENKAKLCKPDRRKLKNLGAGQDDSASLFCFLYVHYLLFIELYRFFYFSGIGYTDCRFVQTKQLPYTIPFTIFVFVFISYFSRYK
jgi:hypothetical protein